MKRLIGLIALTVILCFGLAPLTYAADQPAAGSQTVKGDLLKIEGEFYVVKDAAGKEVRLHVDNSTKLEGTFKAGDKIEAQATDKGHAVSIKPAM
ncbi:MAG: hypothetical protein HY581_02205 [Nitrospirae bacterium]|nr:hypothetical protein [Nitrospirota bacterium]